MTADAKAASVTPRTRNVFGSVDPPRDGPRLLDVASGSLFLMMEGVFGPNDAPKMWWKKVSGVLGRLEIPHTTNVSWTLHCARPRRISCWVWLVSTWTTCWDRERSFELKVKELDKFVGLGSVKRDKFVHFGHECEKHSSGGLSASMASHIHNLCEGRGLARSCSASRRFALSL